MWQRLMLGLTAGAVACQSQAPVAQLALDPAREVAPVSVHLDARGSRSPGGRALLARFDFEGDGVFDTEPGPLEVEHLYTEPGSWRPRVELVDGEDERATAEAALTLSPNQLPLAVLSATPARGPITLEVEADASGSSDPDPGQALLFRFAFAGSFAGDPSPTPRARHVFRAPGRYPVRVEVRDSRGGVSVAERTVEVEPAADLDGDTDHDGLITEADDEGEERWGGGRGMVVLANVDDDDGDGRRDGGDEVLSGIADLADLGVVLVRQHDALAAGDQARVSVEPAGAARFVRLFLEGEDGSVALLLAPGEDGAALPVDRLAAGDLRLFVEATGSRSATWDGNATLRLVVERAGRQEEDALALRVAPVLFPDNTLPPERLYVMRIDDPQNGENVAFYQALEGGVPDGVELYPIDENRYFADRWAQDNMQTGYQVVPIEGGLHVMQTYLQTQRPTGPYGLESFLPEELLGADRGYVYSGGRDTSLDYGGNLEVAPPHTAFGVERPFGRLLVGGGDLGTLSGRPYADHMAEAQVGLLEAQNTQGPAVELSTEWLVVGHIDEIFQFVPVSSGPRPFKVVLASPRLAKEALDRLAEAGLADAAIFRGRQEETTVGAVLADSALLSFNEAAQARIDTVRERLAAELELVEDDFVLVPVLYMAVPFDGLDLAVAFNPAIQNLVTLGDTLFVPDPEGPVDQGEDVWRRLSRERLEALGLRPVFVDVFASYHVNFGEAHCGTEVQRRAFSRAWWEVE